MQWGKLPAPLLLVALPTPTQASGRQVQSAAVNSSLEIGKAMLRVYTAIIVLLLLFTVSSNAQSNNGQPIRVIETERAQLALYFDTIQQGRVGLIEVTGRDIAQVSATFGRDALNIFTLPSQDGYYAFIAVNWERAPRDYDLLVTVRYSYGLNEDLRARVTVRDGNFLRQTVILQNENSDLLNQDVEAQELAQLFELAAPLTPQPLWAGKGWMTPVDGELSSPFGVVRLINGFYDTRHTGWDFNVDFGVPMTSVASGRVVFADEIPLRGNYVLVDHGMGLYTGYAHLSVTYVTQGQNVNVGQVVGRVGSSGRSTSAHAHVEMIAEGNWVDIADFLRMWVPS
jgi:murein DD-endopeptidase MepM/ murein hydrolase activator NlpD